MLFLICSASYATNYARSHLVEGNALADPPLRPVRVTQLVGLMSVYGLWLKTHDQEDRGHFEFVAIFAL